MTGLNLEALAALGRAAGEYADAYVRVSEQLIKRGVPEPEAREEASRAANIAAYSYDVEPCPVCGHDPEER